MSLPKYASPLSINITSSRLLLGAMLVLHGGAILILVISSLPVIIKLMLGLLLVGSFYLLAVRPGWLAVTLPVMSSVARYRSVVWDEMDQWRLLDDESREHLAVLMPNTYVHRYLVVINLRLLDMPWYKRNVSLIFLPDNIDEEVFRRLRIRLRWYSSQTPDNSAVLK